jgi:diketogulonate reductase-like aldo/keto reductase
MRTVALPGGVKVPALGMGTWMMGDGRSARAAELAALREGIDLGLTLIDTAEMYGNGRSEQLVGEAITGRRSEVFLVSKVLPSNASLRGTVAACEHSLKNLNTDCIDLYLLHWRGSVPFAETLEAFAQLQRAGKIKHYGVSNLDLADMREWWCSAGGSGIVTNQLLYNLSRRGIEFDLLPWLRDRKITTMAYSPLEQARLLDNAGLKAVAKQAGILPAQLALAWLLRNDDVIVIPKSGSAARVRENAGARDVVLSADVVAELVRLYPPPVRAQPLEML